MTAVLLLLLLLLLLYAGAMWLVLRFVGRSTPAVGRIGMWVMASIPTLSFFTVHLASGRVVHEGVGAAYGIPFLLVGLPLLAVWSSALVALRGAERHRIRIEGSAVLGSAFVAAVPCFIMSLRP